MQTKTFVVIFLLLTAGLTIVSATDLEAQGDKKPAILMVHGLSGDFSRWDNFITSLPADRFATGGSFDVGTNENTNDPLNIKYYPNRGILKNNQARTEEPYQIFTLSFLNSTGLTFYEQGLGVRTVINHILDSTALEEIILVAHSMGGLACRACIKESADNIAGLLTAASPHVGSYCGLIAEYYDEQVTRFSQQKMEEFQEFADLAMKANYIKIFNSPADYLKLAAFLDARELVDGTTMLQERVKDLSLTANTLAVATLNAGTYIGKGLKLNDPAVRYLVPVSLEMQDLYDQEFPPDLPVSVIISTWEPENHKAEKNVFKDAMQPAYLNVSGLQIIRILKGLDEIGEATSDKYVQRKAETKIGTMAQIEKTLKEDFLQPDEDIYPPNGNYYVYTDGIVTTYSQDILNGIANPNDVTNIAYFGTDRFHTEVPNDTEIMYQALEYLLNPNVKGVKVGLILDSSGSMSSNDPGNVRIKAAESVLQILQEGDQAFIVDFDNQATFLNAGNTHIRNGSSLGHYLYQVDSEGGTDIGGGLSKMTDALNSTRVKDYSSTGVLLLTDGQGNYNGEVEWFKQREIPVFTVSYREFADASLMDSLARYTGGAYIRADTENDVFRAFKEFYNGLSGFSTVYRETFTSDGFNSRPVYVDVSAREMIVYLNGLTPAASSIRYRDPSKQEHNLAESGSVIYGDNYIYAKIPLTQSGYYSFYMTPMSNLPGTGSGPDPGCLPPVLNPYTFEVSINTDIKVGMTLDEKKSGYYSFNFIDQSNSLNKGASKAEITVTTPSGRTKTLKSQDNNGSLTFFPLEGKGNYNLDATFHSKTDKGAMVERHYFKSLLVGDFHPGYIGEVFKVMGNSLYTEQGKLTGNRQGIKVEVFGKGSNLETPIARGYVTSVSPEECIIELQFYKRKPLEGDIVLLDLERWKGD